MADLDSLGFKSIIDMDTDEAIDTLRQIRLSRRVPDKKPKAAKETTKQTTKKVSAMLDSNMAEELLNYLEADMKAEVTFENRYPMEFVLGQDGNQKTAVKHNFECLATDPCGFGDTEKDAVLDLCAQLYVVPLNIIFR